MQALSLDIRERIIDRWQQGESKTFIARRFLVSLSSMKRFIKRFETYGHVRPTIQRRMQGRLTKNKSRALLPGEKGTG